jgi:hypothetical protein
MLLELQLKNPPASAVGSVSFGVRLADILTCTDVKVQWRGGFRHHEL